ncbi:MAG: marine proteobacterial sortase target protein, partial [Rhodospirillaceae bacterium]|nr:marine proteobacterial sortase target protein [Rhodospirillaceae bacterium]
ANSEMGPSVRPGDMGAGSLLLRGVGEEAYRAALVQKTEAEIEVSGLITRAVVRQTFENHSTIHMEGIYVFPLPNGAAVDGLRLVVGERVIEGRIEERKKAQAQFAQAKRQGKRAAMVEAERPNIFTTSVANIAPGETVRVEIRYQQTLTYKNDELRLRFPMVVGPRFIPGPGRIAHFGQDGWAANPVLVGSAKVPPKTDGERIAQPVERPGPNGERTLNPVSLTIRLNAGFPLMEIKSHHHKVTLDTIGEGRRVITLDPGTVPADRDFELTWRPLQGASPQAGLFVETDAPVRTGPHTRHALLMLLPPHAGAVDKARPPRELLFILDTSGSMGGASIRQAKAALDRALDSLGGGDHFNIVEFNSLHSVLFPASMPADAVHLTHARAWISGLAADGGTNMAPALAAALGQPVRAGLLRQVVFLTDGAVGDEARLFALIGKELGAARLFTVGIGSAPNSHFMAGAARAGRGSYLHIGSTAQVGARMDELIAKLSLPALTDIQVRFEGGGATELARDPVPDLYAGEPLMVAVKLTGRVETMTVTGRRGGEVWSQAMDLQGGQMGAGIAKLWAQRRIAALEEDPDRNEDRSGTEAKVLALALDYGLVSRLTALIAIDNVITRGDEDPLLSQAMAANLPADWQYDKVFGKPSPLRMRRASMHLQPTPHASAYSGAYTGGGAVGLPATATPSSMLMAGGLILLLLSLALFGWRRVGLRP